MNKLTLSTLALLLTLGIAGCSDNESEGVDMEKAADNAEEMTEDAGDAIEETYEDATGQQEGPVEQAGESMEEAGDEVEEAAEDATNN